MSESICKTCRKASECGWHESSAVLVGCSGYERKSIVTNADHIRAMTDEELAETFADACPSERSSSRCREYYLVNDHGCVNCWLDWLKQEVKDET